MHQGQQRNEVHSCKSPKINTIMIKSVLESNSKRSRKRSVQQNCNVIQNVEIKNIVSLKKAPIFTKTMKWKRTFLPLLLFTSDQNVSTTSSKTWVHLKMFKFFSSFHQPKNWSQSQRSYFCAGAVTTSSKIYQNRFIAVKGVEYKKTVEIQKELKMPDWFSEVINVFFNTCKKRLEDSKNIGSKVAFHW